ncbi:tagaturonate reductase [Salibacterium halotolerans]|uniref:Tagaturonate reductase n=1 Tax=Salibacterium halotolerans TaxID=1884432 RepID=A0A1I5X506_9BACI|nr:tagaturonate reductase [Salibacterium halotolerans]SFQ27040.1 tagaturonate reductase [Salibacterium halotolerans]
MERLSYDYLKKNNPDQLKNNADLPVKVLQIGEGNFMRGFLDWMIEHMNRQGLFNGSVAALQPTPHGRKIPDLHAQDNAYTVQLRGRLDGRTIDRADLVTAISTSINPYEEWEKAVAVARAPGLEVLTSNTTEAGIVYQEEDWNRDAAPLSFPGKTTQLLYERYTAFDGDPDKGLVLLPCELVERNGDVLKDIVLRKIEDWSLSGDFRKWVTEHNEFCQTLVDRIVTGYPAGIEEYQEKLGYEDRLLTVAEPYHLFVIEGGERARRVLPLEDAGLNAVFGPVEDYAELKIRLLNAPHTMMFAPAFLYGVDTVYEAMQNPDIRAFVEGAMDHAIKPVLPYDKEEKDRFARDVLERFDNPYQRHMLTDLGQNGMQKFGTRVQPIWEKWDSRDPANQYFTLALAALLVYYQPQEKGQEKVQGYALGRDMLLRDSEEKVNKMYDLWRRHERQELSTAALVEECTDDSVHAPLVGEYIDALLENGAVSVLQQFHIDAKEEIQ